MRRIALLVGIASAFAVAPIASAATITNGTVTLGVNPQGDLNDAQAGVGLSYNATGNDATIQGLPAEGWGSGAGGPTQFAGVANESAGNSDYRLVSFSSTATR